MNPRHRAETTAQRRRRANQISWSVVAYLVVVVLVKHYFGVDVSPL
jgi:predicted nucleic acid-binding Zn ribbon protein